MYSYNECMMTCMGSESQVPIDPVAEIAAAITALRRPRRAPDAAAEPGESRHHGGGRGRRGPGGPGMRGFGGAAMHRLLHVLDAAGRRGQQLGISEVAEAIGVDQPRSSRLVAEAAARGYVIRATDARDARRSDIRIAEAGRSHLAHVEQRRRAAVEAALADFTAEETAQLARLLARFAEAWSMH